MPALTQLLDKPILDPSGEEFARLHDLVVKISPEAINGPAESPASRYPPVTGLVARIRGPRGARDVYIPWEQVKNLDLGGAQLASPGVNLRRFARRNGEIVLRDALLDRQVVDVEGHRVVRVNDLDLAKRNGTYRLIAVDISPAGLLRRATGGRLDIKRVPHGPLIDWAQVYPLANGGEGVGQLQLRVPRSRLDLLKPADLARIVEQLSPQQGADFLEGLDEARAADTLEELEDEQQGQILRAMDPEKAADVLQEMEPDEATDALQSVPAEEAADLLKRMDREEADEVQELLGYPEDSAGGIMTTDYLSLPAWATVDEATSALRAHAAAAARGDEDPLPEALQEVFVVDPAEDQAAAPLARPTNGRSNGRRGPTSRPRPPAPTSRQNLSLYTEGTLVGRVSVRDLLLADPGQSLGGLARPVPHPAHPMDNEREVARVIAEEDLLSLPVVDDDNQLLGIVTVDDAIDVILPTAWKKRIPRLFH